MQDQGILWYIPTDGPHKGHHVAVTLKPRPLLLHCECVQCGEDWLAPVSRLTAAGVALDEQREQRWAS